MDKLDNKFDYKNYNDYIALSKVNTKAFLMLSELIDNSISSFEKRYGSIMSEWEEKLTITIEILLKSKKKEIAKNGIEFFSENSITVSDNAFGMDGETLIDALKLNKRNVGNSNGHASIMNVHGRGLKQSAFFFGNSLNVVSSNGVESNEITLDATIQDSLETAAEFVAVPKVKNSRGTIISIKNLNNRNGVITYKKLGEIFSALSSRYSGFLEDEDKFEIIFKNPLVNSTQNNGYGTTMTRCLLEIDYSHLKSKLESFTSFDIDNNNFKLKEFSIPRFKFNQASLKKGAFKRVEDLKTRYIIKCDKYLDGGTLGEIDPEVFKISRDKILALIEEVELGESNDFKWQVKYKSTTSVINKMWLFNFYKVDAKKINGKTRWRGIFIKEGHRFLMHGPNTAEQTAYVSWEKTTSTGSTQNSFGGTFNITHYDEITSHTDKSHMSCSNDVQEEMDLIIYSSWKAFDMFEMVFRDRDSNKNSASIADKHVAAAIEDRYPEGGDVPFVVNEATFDVSNSSLTLNTNIDDNNKEWDIKIIAQSSKNITAIILDTLIDEDKKKFTLYFNKNASIWSKADSTLKGVKLYAELIVPMLMQLSVYFINMKLQKFDKDIANFNNMDEEL